MKLPCLLVYSAILLLSLCAAAQSKCTITSFDEVSNVLNSCRNVIIGNLTVPAHKTLNLQPQDNSVITVSGTINFQNASWEGPLIQINATGLILQGLEGHAIDGNGHLYWDGLGEWGCLKPHFTFISAANSIFRNLNFVRSPRYFILISDSKNLTFTDMLLDNSQGDPEVAPNKSGHNTDGFDVFNCTDILIQNSKVYNQDDCVALRHGKRIHIDNLFCHGGHGLSMSVGFSNTSVEQNILTDVVIENSQVINGQNAIHIKTHVDATKGKINNITYRNITFGGQTNFGIEIQQNYRNTAPGEEMPKDAQGNIPITNVTFSYISGYVNGSKAEGVYINCAEGACSNWNWDHINVTNAVAQVKNYCNFEPSGYVCGGGSASAASLISIFISVCLAIVLF